MHKYIVHAMCCLVPNSSLRKKIRKKLLKQERKKTMRNQMMFDFFPVSEHGLVQPQDKILIVAPHPDDEVIACGGFIAKYHAQIDILCINSSGVKYNWNTETAEEIAEQRCTEFHNVIKSAKINKFYIAKIWGTPPMFEGINAHFETYLENFDFRQYDYIFIPHQYDGHREHRFVGNHLIPRILDKSGYKKTLKMVAYEVWNTMTNVNYFEDITDYVDKKNDLILKYASRNPQNYSDRILALNFYRGLSAQKKYVEAYQIIPISEYLAREDDKSWSRPC